MTILVLAGAGCTAPEPPLRVALLVWPAYELPYLARERGYLPDDIELVSFRSPAEAQRAYEQRLVDVVALTLSYAVELTGRDPSNRVIFVIDYSAGGDAVVAKPDIASLTELRGRRVVVEASALGLHMLSRALASVDLTLDEVELVPLDIGDQVEAFASESIAAAVTYEPFRSSLLAEGAHELFDSRQMPGEIVDVLMTHEATLQSRRPALEGLVQAWLRAGREVRSDPEGVAVMADREGVTPEAFRASLELMTLVGLEENRRLLGGQDRTLAETADDLQRLMESQGLIEASRPLDDLFDASIVEGVAR